MLGIARPTMPGYRVSAGDLIAHGLGEISVEKHLDGNGVPSPCNAASIRTTWGDLPGCTTKRRFHSIFEFMTDEVFAQYRAVADVTRDDFMISAEERSANPLRCEGEDFATRDVDAYVFLQGSPEIEDSTLAQESAALEGSLPSVESLAAGRAVLLPRDRLRARRRVHELQGLGRGGGTRVFGVAARPVRLRGGLLYPRVL